MHQARACADRSTQQLVARLRRESRALLNKPSAIRKIRGGRSAGGGYWRAVWRFGAINPQNTARVRSPLGRV